MHVHACMFILLMCYYPTLIVIFEMNKALKLSLKTNFGGFEID